MSDSPLLGPEEESPGGVSRPEGSSEIVLVCEHASNHLPAALGDLGLSRAERESHIGWDIGALGVAARLSEELDATLVAQRYSRLAYDCNRPPESPAAIPEKSEIYPIPGNAGLSAGERQARADSFYHPFHAEIDRLLDQRIASGRRPVLVTMHSFTPVYFGKERDGRLGILHDVDATLAEAILLAAAAEGLKGVRRNYPYGIADGVTHTLQRHGITRSIPNVMFEIRNDLIAASAGQAEWADILVRLLRAALASNEDGALRHG